MQGCDCDRVRMAPNYTHFTGDPGLPNTQGGFAFRKRWGQIDWRKLASVDVDDITKAMDFQVLQDNIMNIAFCKVETEFHGLDPNFVKLFRMAQLIIEYLLHSQQYLANQITVFELQLQQEQQELDKVRSAKKTADEELKKVKKENRKRRKVIEAYQEMINAGATGLHPCCVCKREFVSLEYLQSHMQRRHPDHLPKTVPDSKQEKRKSQEDLEARLLKQMTEHLQTSEKQLREEMQQKERKARKKQVKEFEEWKTEEQKRMAIKMKEFEKPIVTELEELHKENLKLGKDLHKREIELANSQAKQQQSHIGHLEDAKELILGEVNQLNESKVEIKDLKESLQQQLQDMQTTLKKKDTSWNKRMKSLATSYQDQLKESICKLEVLESNVLEGSRADASSTREVKQKLEEQEKMLQVHQDQLASLQSREASPILKERGDVVVRQQGQQLSVSLSPEARNITQILSGEESESDTPSSEEDQVDLVLKKQFCPFSHRPTITTLYQHDPSDMEMIRQQTYDLFCEALVERGIAKGAVGLKTSDFEQKMSLLKQEQQRQMQMHYHFSEHWKRLVEELNGISTADYESRRAASIIIKPKPQEMVPSALASKSAVSRPPKPKAKVVSYQSDDATSSHKRELHKEPTLVKKRPQESASFSDDDEDDHDEEENGKVQHLGGGHFDTITSLNQISEEAGLGPTGREAEKKTSTFPDSTYNNTSHKVISIKIKSAGNDDQSAATSPWDSSEEDSVDGAFVVPAGRTSSTPIKAYNELNAAGLPAHEVVLVTPQDNISLDSFDMSSSNDQISTIPHYSKMSSSARNQMPSNTYKNATSPSAVKNESVEDFDFSDLSDITLS